MQSVPIPFAGQAYADRTRNANAQTCVNFYPFRSPTPGDPSRVILYPTPGYRLYYDASAEIRGLFTVNDTLYLVAGASLRTIKDSGGGPAATTVGTLNTSTGRCSIQCNTVQLAISDGIFGYIYDLSTGTFSTISGGGWPSNGVTNFAFIDDYILAVVNGSRQVIQSDLLDAGTYDAQAFVNVASFSDNLVAVYSDQMQLYLFGPTQTEVRYNSGATPFAFQKVQGVIIQAGCVAWPTIVRAGATVIWLARDQAGKAFVAALEGYNPRVLSSAPMNEAMERYGTFDDAFAYTYREGDNQFYMLTFPTEKVTWGIDLKTGMPHQRRYDGGADLPRDYILFNSRHIVSSASGKLYKMSQDFLDDGSGNGLVRERTCQHLRAGGAPFFIHELQVDIESGVGLLSGQGSSPLATLYISRDGGNTWTNAGTAGMGKRGQYLTRLIWRRLGRFLDTATFRLVISDPVRTYILGATAKITVGTK